MAESLSHTLSFFLSFILALPLPFPLKRRVFCLVVAELGCHPKSAESARENEKDRCHQQHKLLLMAVITVSTVKSFPLEEIYFQIWQKRKPVLNCTVYNA